MGFKATFVFEEKMNFIDRVKLWGFLSNVDCSIVQGPE
jgi:hypothetical protein